MLILIALNAKKYKLYKMVMELDPVEEMPILPELVPVKYQKGGRLKNVCLIILDFIGS